MNEAPATPMIVVGVDGSQDGLRAVVFGARSALRRDADLLLVNAVDDAVLAGSWGVVYDPSVLQQAGETATETARQTAMEVGLDESRIKTDVLLGNPSAVLIRLSEMATFIVVGRRSASGLERMFVGSTSVSVVAGAQCPIIVVSAASNPEPTGDKGAVLVGLESSASSLSAIKAGFEQASIRNVMLRLVHILQPPMGLFGPKMSPDELDQQIVYVRGGIDAMIEPLKESYPDIDVSVEVVAGAPINDLVARSAHADLLVLGVGEPGLGFALGGLTRGLMAHAKCPLMLTR